MKLKFCVFLKLTKVKLYFSKIEYLTCYHTTLFGNHCFGKVRILGGFYWVLHWGLMRLRNITVLHSFIIVAIMEAENAKNKVVKHQSYIHSKKNKYPESSMYQQYTEKLFDNHENML